MSGWTVADWYITFSLNPYYTGSYSMRNIIPFDTRKSLQVLILIILEVTLWDIAKPKDKEKILLSLNPYYTGSYSMRVSEIMTVEEVKGLNPYYTGSYPMSSIATSLYINYRRLNPYYTGSYSMSFGAFMTMLFNPEVLILIILEVTLWVDKLLVM